MMMAFHKKFHCGFLETASSTLHVLVASCANFSACWISSTLLCQVNQQGLTSSRIHDSALQQLITALDLVVCMF